MTQNISRSGTEKRNGGSLRGADEFREPNTQNTLDRFTSCHCCGALAQVFNCPRTVLQWELQDHWTDIVTTDQQPEQPSQGGTPGSSGVWTPQWDLYHKHAAQAWTDQQASSDDFDKNLLTLSSGALGVSLAFIKDIVPLKDAVMVCWLYVSWATFAACIIATIFSFPLSIQAQKVHVEYLYRYYIEGKQEFLNRESGWSKAVTVCAAVGAIFFTAGLVATLVFAFVNVSRVHK